MRDIVKYPVTTDEIVRLLNQYLERERGGLAIGDMTILILEEAVKRIQEDKTPRVLYHGTIDELLGENQDEHNHKDHAKSTE